MRRAKSEQTSNLCREFPANVFVRQAVIMRGDFSKLFFDRARVGPRKTELRGHEICRTAYGPRASRPLFFFFKFPAGGTPAVHRRRRIAPFRSRFSKKLRHGIDKMTGQHVFS